MLKTRSGLPKHCTWQTDKHGVRRCRFRRRGVSVYLPGIPWGAEFMPAYAAALELTETGTAASSSKGGGPGSIDALVRSYDELVLPLLAEATRVTRRGILARFCAEFGRDLVVNFKHQHITAIIADKAKKSGKHAANNQRKVLRHLFKHAVRIGWREDNPVVETESIKAPSRGFHTWTDEEFAIYRARWPLGTQQRLAMELALETTSRRADITKIGPQHIRGGKLDLRHTKNNSEAFIPISGELRAAIDAMGPIKHLTFLHTRKGAPRSPKALGGDFRQWCDAAGLPKHCSLHGLRKGGARRLAEAGASAKEIMSVTGHKTLSEVQRYVDAADNERLAEEAFAKLSKRAKSNAQ
jgi:integrase